MNFRPWQVFFVPDEKQILCLVSAKAEGATWEQIDQMWPHGGGHTAKAMGKFMHDWLPDWSPSFSPGPAAARAAVRNYIQKHDPNYRAPEWMAN